MFFRRAAAKHLTFEDHMNAARAAGFKISPEPGGKTRIERNGIAAIAEPGPGDIPNFTTRAGVVMGREIGTLTDGGFQKFFITPSGKRKPALAEELKEIQAFQEDLREALGLVSLYNEALGTVSNVYLYDRVEGRDKGEADKPWEVTSSRPRPF
ncbi:MAG TPA: hypothetical protein VG273_11110 [Bryobacteraceae bacterium]|jgi:hypothetical protein|nr:hypothetical protein [Bryobacteraceae bacterium]